MPDERIILFFDGVCGLCNGLVDWLLPRDKKKKIKFATLQGATALDLLPQNLREDLNTVVLWYKGQLLTESTAILTCLNELGGLWRMVIFFKLIPSFIRNAIYKLVARFRYKLFGQLSTCRLPTAAERQQFLD
jgi:predicted DCC family thiol-disulfide oxidoreductase YuxK